MLAPRAFIELCALLLFSLRILFKKSISRFHFFLSFHLIFLFHFLSFSFLRFHLIFQLNFLSFFPIFRNRFCIFKLGLVRRSVCRSVGPSVLLSSKSMKKWTFTDCKWFRQCWTRKKEGRGGRRDGEEGGTRRVKKWKSF